jgi:hypothetical protein
MYLFLVSKKILGVIIMSEEKTKKPFYKKWWVWVIAIIVIAGIASQGEDSSTPEQLAKLAEDPVILTRPDQQKNFVAIVSNAIKAAKNVENDMQKGGILNTRGKEICELLKTLAVKDWTGWVESIDTNSDGKGVLGIKLARNINVETWNNAMSDITSKTLIEPGSELFNKAASMKKGSRVKFSGTFFKDDTHCIDGQSMGLAGKVEDPEFTFRFSTVSLIK